MNKLFIIIYFLFCLNTYATIPEPIFVSFKENKCKLTKVNKQYLDREILESITILNNNNLTFEIDVSYAYLSSTNEKSYLSYFKKAVSVLNYIVEKFQISLVNVNYKLKIYQIEEMKHRYDKEGVYVFFLIINNGEIRHSQNPTEE